MNRRRLGPIAALVTLAVLGGSGVAVAVWTASASVSATASSTSPATTVGLSGGLNTTYSFNGPKSGVAVRGALEITNTGGAPLTYALTNTLAAESSAALAKATDLTLWVAKAGVADPCNQPIPTTGTVKTTLAEVAPALPAGAQTLAAGAKVTVCVATSLPKSLPSSANEDLPGQKVTATFAVTGAVAGSSWTASATATSVTQTVYRLGPVRAIACNDNTALNLTVSWTAPASKPTGAQVSYRVYDVANPGVALGPQPTTATSLQLSPDTWSRNGTYRIAVEATESLHGTTSKVVETSITRELVWWAFFVPALSCA
ncbi:hypothetical protein [Microbacterium sp. zg-YB36]|uniref:hypothetical protein n=1 Tax=Microbacterium sp. zg-YB36 TaxID=2969407 RepID=UPI00214C3844|nr:hypothetical protein [Microbacterium sp. zg-YB36]MDL5352062.1 hypothetical protein [Microbacterium sp. zg-YB36]